MIISEQNCDFISCIIFYNKVFSNHHKCFRLLLEDAVGNLGLEEDLEGADLHRLDDLGIAGVGLDCWLRQFVIVNGLPLDLSLLHFLDRHVGSEGHFFHLDGGELARVSQVGLVPVGLGNSLEVNFGGLVDFIQVFEADQELVSPGWEGQELDGVLDTGSSERS